MTPTKFYEIPMRIEYEGEKKTASTNSADHQNRTRTAKEEKKTFTNTDNSTFPP